MKGLADRACAPWVLPNALLALGVVLSWFCYFGREGKEGRYSGRVNWAWPWGFVHVWLREIIPKKNLL